MLYKETLSVSTVLLTIAPPSLSNKINMLMLVLLRCSSLLLLLHRSRRVADASRCHISRGEWDLSPWHIHKKTNEHTDDNSNTKQQQNKYNEK